VRNDRLSGRSLPLFLALLFVALTASLAVAQSGPVQYGYDALGRLVIAVDGAGQAAIYQYDAVGNLLSIDRVDLLLLPGAVALAFFTPSTGPAGTTVSIFGKGFSATPAQNTVAFNGAAAIVTAASPTRLVVTVSRHARPRSITVTAPAGSATTSAAFTVTGSAPPTITGFTPTMGTPGTVVTITGTNFEPVPLNDRVAFNLTQATVASATTAALATSVPPGATSGRISVTTPLGKAVSSTDFFVPPPPYTAAAIGATDRIAFGQTKTITLSTPNTIALVLFDGAATQRMSLNLTNSTIGPSWVTVRAPDGTTLAAQVAFSGVFIDATVLPATGTYTIVIEPLSAGTGSLTLSLYDVVDVTGPITPGGAPVTVTLTTPGQNARLTFSGDAGQQVSLRVLEATTAVVSVYLLKPDGSTLDFLISGPFGAFLDATTLPVTGTYTLRVDPFFTHTGSVTLRLYNIIHISGGTAVGGAALPVTTTTPGQNATVTFVGTSGQGATVRVTNNAIGLMVVKLLTPDGTALTSGFFSGDSFELTPQTLPTTGTYTIALDPFDIRTGSLDVQVTSP